MCSTPTASASTPAAVVASALLSPAEKLAQIKAWVSEDAACCDSVASYLHTTPAAKSAYGARTPVAMIPETPGPSTRGRPKSFLEKMLQLRHAPRELFIIFSIKFAESTAYYAFSYVYVAYLSEEFDFSDVEAGVLYTLYGLLCSVIGLLAGPLIDAIDLRTALLIGTIPSFLGRFGSAVTTSRSFVSMCSYALLPLGAAFSMPVFALGVRRFTHAENRAFAFTVFYAVLCVASMTGGLLITWVRANFHDGITLPLLGHLSWMRVNVLVTALFTLYTSIISCFVRKIRVRQDVPIETGETEECPRGNNSLGLTLSTVCGSKPFWKLLGLSLIVALGTRATFRHLDATFPKYFMRMHGDDAPFELFVAVEPVITVLLSFPVTYFLLQKRASTFASLVGGTLLQSFCPLALVLGSSYANSVAFVIFMALGEAIWSPRLYEYSTMVAPDGFEGTFVAVTFVPQYVSAGIVGVESGYLLEHYVPEECERPECEYRRPWMLWGVVAAASFLSPALLALFRSRLFGEEPTLQHDVATVAAKRGPRTGRRGSKMTTYGMVAADEDSPDVSIADEDEEGGGGSGVAPAAVAAAAASTPPRSPGADLKRATTVERSPLVERRAMADDDDDDDEAEEGEEARQRNGHNRI